MSAGVPVRSRDFSDVIERVLTGGIAFEITEDVDASTRDRGTSAWFRISIAGVEVFKVVAGVSSRYLPSAGDVEE